MTKAKNFAAAIGIMLLLLFFSLPANAASDPQLDNLEIIGSDKEVYLSEDDFRPADTDYSLKLDSAVTYLNVYVEKEYSTDIIKVEYAGKSISLKSSYYKVSVDTDDLDDITITVIDKKGEKNVYTVALAAAGSKDGEILNITATLGVDGSKKAKMYPAFDPSVREYTVLVPYNKGNVVNFELDLPNKCTFAYNGKKIADPGRTYNIDFTAKWGDHKSASARVNGELYKFHVYFAPANAAEMIRLEDLAVRDKVSSSSSNNLKFDSKFDRWENEYQLNLGSKEYKKLYLYAEASDDDQLIFVENQLLTDDYWQFDPQEYNKITVTVFAENLRDYEEYTITLDTPAATNKLSSLNLLGSKGQQISYTPALADGKYSYTASVDNSVSSIIINAKSKSPVSISQNGVDYIKGETFTADLAEGLNSFEIKVGSNVYYHLNVYRNALNTVIIPSNQYISLDNGTAQRISAYNINGNNFVKLRDIAYMLNGTGKQFSVAFDSASNLITMNSGRPYISVGGEMAVPGTYKQAIVSKQKVLLNNAAIAPAAYNIDGNNYFLLRDLAALLDFAIDFRSNVVYIYSDLGYGQTKEDQNSDKNDVTFNDIGLRISGVEGTYLKRADFDPQQKSLTVDISEKDKELSIYTYYDNSIYDVNIRYNDEYADVSEGSYRQGYGYAIYTVEVDTDELYNITVTFTNDVNETVTYKIKLRA